MADSEPFVVVLTGGIASGKTAISDLFAQRGVAIIDTDRIAHEIVEPGCPALERIAKMFGPEYLDAEGRLRRRKMRDAIFQDPQLKTRLEGILHPAIAAEVDQRIAQVKQPWCILVVPLLTETSLFSWINRVLVVDVEESVQIERVMDRDNITHAQAQTILDAQINRQQRLMLADDTLDNSGSLEQLEAQVDKLYRKYSALARKHQQKI